MAAKPSLNVPEKEHAKNQIIIAVFSYTNAYTQVNLHFSYFRASFISQTPCSAPC